ncbi:2538_t:CDS:1, partial [Racocetra fulgida]
MNELLGVLFRTKQPEGTIGIVVGPSVDSFEHRAFKVAIEVKTSVYPIIIA